MEDKEKLIGDKKIPLKTLIKRALKYMKPVRVKLIFAFILILINVVLDVVLPRLVGNVVDLLQSEIDVNSNILSIIIGTSIAYLLVTLLNQGFRLLEGYLLSTAGNSIVYNLRVDTFKHIEEMSLDQFEVMPTGSLVTRVCSYTAQLSDLFTNQLVNLLRNFISIVGIYSIMLTISPMLSLIILGFAVIVLIVSIFFRKKTSKLFRLEKGYISDLNTTISEDISGMKIIQIFNQEKQMRDAYYIKNKKFRDTRYKMMSYFSFYKPFINFLSYVAVAVVFIFGLKYNLSGGEVLLFYLYISRFFSPIEEICHQYVHIERALTSCERLFNLLDVKPKVVDSKLAKEVTKFNGKIEFKHVWFSYDNKNWVLKDVSFVINKGETCAFVGATGAGKTTILSLLVKSYVPQKGKILIDGKDISKIKISSLRRGIGQMLQDVFLFSGSIKDNITLFDESYKDEAIEDAAKYVNADTFIDKLDEKYDTKVVERGDNFSAGQRQLMSFARTILHKPQILLLDEATANIDTETEVVIQDSLKKMKSLGTMLVVAHRLSTIKDSDQIICLQNGEIIERGTHQELIKNKGYYYKLNQLQFNK